MRLNTSTSLLCHIRKVKAQRQKTRETVAATFDFSLYPSGKSQPRLRRRYFPPSPQTMSSKVSESIRRWLSDVRCRQKGCRPLQFLKRVYKEIDRLNIKRSVMKACAPFIKVSCVCGSSTSRRGYAAVLFFASWREKILWLRIWAAFWA